MTLSSGFTGQNRAEVFDVSLDALLDYVSSGLGTENAYGVSAEGQADNVDSLISQTRLRRQSRVAVRSGASWLSLVAATTKGLGQLGRVRVKIRSLAPLHGTTFRLVVHSYAASALLHDEPPAAALMPIASLQRAVSEDELCSGLELDLVHVGASTPVPDDFLVFAWVEPGHPDFAYDAALARPSVGALKGRALSRPQRQDCRVAEVLLTAA